MCGRRRYVRSCELLQRAVTAVLCTGVQLYRTVVLSVPSSTYEIIVIVLRMLDCV